MKAGFVRFVNMDMRNYIYSDIWQDLRKKNIRQNWKSFRRKTCARGQRMRCSKSEGLSRGTGNPGTSQWVEAIDELRSEYPLDLLLELRRIAHSVFYYHLERLEGQDKYAVEKEEIKSIFHHNGVYHNLYVNSSRHSNSCKHSEIVLLPTQTGMLMYITSI